VNYIPWLGKFHFDPANYQYLNDNFQYVPVHAALIVNFLPTPKPPLTIDIACTSECSTG
jgi:hypothetical protein